MSPPLMDGPPDGLMGGLMGGLTGGPPAGPPAGPWSAAAASGRRTLRFYSASRAETRLLGAAMAACVSRLNPGSLLFYAPLGAGKSALTSALVRALPGGERAECSSPSFTICNIYYTAPVTRHFDLYRLAPGLLNDDLAGSLDETTALTIVEWAENMAAADAPADGLACRISEAGLPDPAIARLEAEQGDEASGRFFDFAALGPVGDEFLRLLSLELESEAALELELELELESE